MLRSSLTAVFSLSLIGLIAACAQGANDPIDNSTAEQTKAPTEPEQSVKLPPPSQPATTTPDAGTTTPKDAGSTSSSSSSSSSSSGGSSSGGSSSSSSSSSSGGAAVTCDMNNSLYLVEALAELNKSTPRTCDFAGNGCSAGECCFTIYGVCVNQ